MSGNLSVTFQDLQSGSNMLNQGSADIQEKLQYMRNQLEPINATWQGQAKAQFDGLWMEWESGARQLRESLEGISKLLQVAASSYQDAEQQIGQTFQA